MKRIKSILLIAMLSLLGFSSCADKEDKDLVINIETLKSFTGKTLSQVQESLSGYGYEYLGFDESRLANVFIKGRYKLLFVLNNDIVFVSGCMGSTEKAIAYVDYKDYASKCATYASKGVYDFSSWVGLKDGYEEFDNYEDSMTFFDEYKEDIELIIQGWENDNESFGAWLEAEDLNPVYVISYADMNLSADFEPTKSTLFSRK